MIIVEKIEKLKQNLEKLHWWENLESLIFPPMCGICGKLNENYLCGKCNLELQKSAEYRIDTYITEAGFKRKYFEEQEKCNDKRRI